MSARSLSFSLIILNLFSRCSQKENDEQLLANIQALVPDYSVRLASTGSEWYCLGGIVDRQGHRVAKDLVEWIERTLIECGRDLQTLIDHTQQNVNGWVRLKLYKGNVIVVSRDSKTDSLFDPTIATFEDDAGAYDQKDASGFIRLNALRMRIAANRAESRAGKKKG